MWKGNSVSMAGFLFAGTAAIAVSVFAALFTLAAPSSMRVEAHRYYIQGHQRGRFDAMAKRELRQSFDKMFDSDRVSQSGTGLTPTFPRDDLRQEYLRGYRDGYQLIAR